MIVPISASTDALPTIICTDNIHGLAWVNETVIHKAQIRLGLDPQEGSGPRCRGSRDQADFKRLVCKVA